MSAVRAALLVGLISLTALIPPRRPPGLAKPPPQGYGVAIAYGLGGTGELAALGPHWYTDYDYRGDVLDEYQRLYVVKTSWDLAGVSEIARAHPGEWWQFGNEPNDIHQDNVSPIEYARRYHAFSIALRAADPSARVVPAGLANADWRWAESFRQAYRREFGAWPVLDGWSIHDYLLDSCESATDADLFKSRIEEFRAWMERTGQSDRLLFLTEYGVLYGNGCCNCPAIPTEQALRFMRTTTLWLSEARLVQAWGWFAVRTDGRNNGDLSNPDGTLTDYGTAYRELSRLSASDN